MWQSCVKLATRKLGLTTSAVTELASQLRERVNSTVPEVVTIKQAPSPAMKRSAFEKLRTPRCVRSNAVVTTATSVPSASTRSTTTAAVLRVTTPA